MRINTFIKSMKNTYERALTDLKDGASRENDTSSSSGRSDSRAFGPHSVLIDFWRVDCGPPGHKIVVVRALYCYYHFF